jgi:hypothetical protein
MSILSNNRKEFLVESIPQVFKINEKLLAVEFNIVTMVEPAESIDLTIDLQKQVHVILSQGQYNKLDQSLQTRINNNSNPINFYSQAGGNPITILKNGQHKMGTITYPNHSGTLLSSIKIPHIQENEILYILVDSYPELLTCADPNLRRKLLVADISELIKHINYASSNIEVNIIFDSAIVKLINEFYPTFFSGPLERDTINQFNLHEISLDKMNLFLCDKIFGKVIGGQSQSFNGIITAKDCIIVDAYSDGDLSISIRGSGLSVNGNGKAKILIIIENADSELLIQETYTGLIILNNHTINYEEFKFSEKYIKLYELIKYYDELSKLTLESKKIIKENLVKNCYKNFEIEFCDLEDYIIESELWFISKLNLRVTETIYYLRYNLELIRSQFIIDRSQSNLVERQNDIIQRQYTCQNTSSYPANFITDIPKIPKLQRY